jgi:hypothetical protein
MLIETKFEPRDEVWYFKNTVPTKTEVKKIFIEVIKSPKEIVSITYAVLRDTSIIPEDKLFLSQIDLYASLEDN